MLLQHILAAADESDAGRQAIKTAAHLAARASARLTILRVMTVKASSQVVTVGPESTAINEWDTETALGRLRRWLEADALPSQAQQPYELGLAYGIPGIEICRFAERAQVDLLVLGRKRHSRMMRLLLGDTADAVARRSRLPSLFVSPGAGEIEKVLVALDGSDRGMNVLNQSCDFARYSGAAVQAVTVEPKAADEPLQLVTDLPLARSASLQTRVREVLAREGFPDAPLAIRRGDILERVVVEAQETEADVLAIGFHRGGAPGVLEAGSTARRLA
ncbi:MAG TPA: universal stress protein, partial [Gemmatimonadales bacterium]|nr:universal stress protein [Gemmatimonadales bacterium]